MRSLWAVIALETAQRRVVFLAAAILSLLPWLMPLIWSGADPADLRLATAAVGGLFLSWSLAIALGAAAGGSDLSTGRMSLFYAQPLSAGVIALGKLCAVVLASVGTLIIVTAPTLLFGATRPESLSGLLPFSAVCIVSVVALAIGSHVVSVAVRARSAWLAGTAAALIGTGLATTANGLVLQRAGAASLWPTVLTATVVASVVALLASAWFQFRSGRADLHRSGRALALAVSCFLGVVTLGSVLYSNWAARPALTDLRGVHDVAEVGGGWLQLTGPARWRPGLEPTFLFRPTDGSALRVRTASVHSPYATRAASAGGLASLRAELRQSSWDLSVDWVDLESPPFTVESTGANLLGWPSHLALSSAGERLAVIAPDTLRGGRQRIVVHALPSGRVLAGANLPEGVVSQRSWLGFDSDDSAALVAVERFGEAYRVSRRTISPGTASLSEPFWVPELEVVNEWDVSLSRDGESVSDGRALYSTRSGQQLLTLPEPSTFAGEFLHSGGLFARWSPKRKGGTLQILSSTRPALELDFPAAGWPGFVGRLESGEVLLTLPAPQQSSEPQWSRSLWMVDPDEGTRRLLHESVCSASVSESLEIYVVDCSGNLIAIDLETGARHILISGDLRDPQPNRRSRRSKSPTTLADAWRSLTSALF